MLISPSEGENNCVTATGLIIHELLGIKSMESIAQR